MKTPEPSIFARYTTPETFARIRELPSVSAMWRYCCEEFAEAPAICDDGREFPFADVEREVAGLRTLLAQHPQGTRVGIFAPNSFAFVKGFLAATTLGHTAVVLPAQLDERSLLGCCEKDQVGILLYHPALEEKLCLVRETHPGIRLLCLTESAAEPTPAAPCAAALPCVVMYTGGTTGQSKRALLSNGAVMQGVVNGCYGYREVFGQRYLLVLPLWHVFGLIRNLLTSLYTGSCLYICRDSKDMFRDIALFRPTIWVVVPALAEMALALSKKFGRNMLGDDMKYIICGAAAVPPYLIAEYHKLGITLFPGYGLTESANLVSGNPESLTKPASVGLFYPHQEYRIEGGELWLKGRNLMDGYIGGEKLDGWFRTGDLARVDEEGFLYITGRVSERIVLPSGENISPAEVEAAFNALPFVQDSQVFEDITEGGRHILALEIVPRRTEQKADVDLREELERVNQALPSFQRVNKITIRDSDFARTPSMKIVRYKKCN